MSLNDIWGSMPRLGHEHFRVPIELAGASGLGGNWAIFRGIARSNGPPTYVSPKYGKGETLSSQGEISQEE